MWRPLARSAATSEIWLRSSEEDQSLCTLGMCPENEWEDAVRIVCAKRERSVQLLVAVKVLGKSLRKFSPKKMFSSYSCLPACFEEIWLSADRE